MQLLAALGFLLCFGKVFGWGYWTDRRGKEQSILITSERPRVQWHLAVFDLVQVVRYILWIGETTKDNKVRKEVSPPKQVA